MLVRVQPIAPVLDVNVFVYFVVEYITAGEDLVQQVDL